MQPATGNKPPLILHLIHRLATGGMENGLVNLINHMPPERYRHAVVCLADDTDFGARIQRANVPVIALHKREGNDPRAYAALVRTLRQLRPDILHTRTWAALDAQFCGALARVPGRVHGEHGQFEGQNFRRRLIRKMARLVIQHYTAVSQHLASWLVREAGVAPGQVSQIYNGVDTARFRPGQGRRAMPPECGFPAEGCFVIGSVGRMQPVKAPLNLVRAFLRLREQCPAQQGRLRLVMAGGGPLLAEAQALLAGAGVTKQAWLPGDRSDIPDLLRMLDVFVVPSDSEGTSNTALEAMATGLPVVATRVGGNPEVVEDGATGMLVPAGDSAALARALRAYLDNPGQAAAHGRAGRSRVESHFSMQSMVEGYASVYDRLLARTRPVGSPVAGR